MLAKYFYVNRRHFCLLSTRFTTLSPNLLRNLEKSFPNLTSLDSLTPYFIQQNISQLLYLFKITPDSKIKLRAYNELLNLTSKPDTLFEIQFAKIQYFIAKNLLNEAKTLMDHMLQTNFLSSIIYTNKTIFYFQYAELCFNNKEYVKALEYFNKANQVLIQKGADIQEEQDDFFEEKKSQDNYDQDKLQFKKNFQQNQSKCSEAKSQHYSALGKINTYISLCYLQSKEEEKCIEALNNALEHWEKIPHQLKGDFQFTIQTKIRVLHELKNYQQLIDSCKEIFQEIQRVIYQLQEDSEDYKIYSLKKIKYTQKYIDYVTIYNDQFRRQNQQNIAKYQQKYGKEQLQNYLKDINIMYNKK